jgi:hypothetical protein
MRSLSVLRGLAVAALLASPALARAQAGLAFIGPGQEELLAEMLGKSSALPGGCAWAGASVERARVVSSYGCAGGRVEIELRHPGDAVDAADARTASFAIHVRASAAPAAPAGLVEAIEARVRAREAAFHWLTPGEVEGHAPVLDDERGRALRGLGIALGITALAAALLRWIHRRIVRSTPLAAAAPPSPRAALAFAALAVAVSTALAAAVHRVALAFGDAAIAGLEHRSALSIVASAGAMLAYLALALGASTLLARVPTKLSVPARFAAGALLYLAVTYPMSLAREERSPFGDVIAARPFAVAEETRENRPRITYRTNALGFREPGWSLDKPEGAYRVALFGDSFVYGIGVEVEGTLSAALTTELARKSQGRRVEVVNLGIPGANLATYVDAYAAAERLGADAAVVCLVLPNDLSRWDVLAARRAAQRVGAYSFARFLFGNAAGALWDLARLERADTAAGLAHLDREMTRLTELRAGEAHRPALVVFSYRELAAPIRARLDAVASAGARVLQAAETAPEDFLPGDGHPTAAGNRRFARQLADAIGRE